MTLNTQTVQDGPFTITAVQDTDLQLLFLGAAVCGARDEYDPAIGKAISEGRAMAARAEYYAEHGNPIQETVPVETLPSAGPFPEWGSWEAHEAEAHRYARQMRKQRKPRIEAMLKQRGSLEAELDRLSRELDQCEY